MNQNTHMWAFRSFLLLLAWVSQKVPKVLPSFLYVTFYLKTLTMSSRVFLSCHFSIRQNILTVLQCDWTSVCLAFSLVNYLSMSFRSLCLWLHCHCSPFAAFNLAFPLLWYNALKATALPAHPKCVMAPFSFIVAIAKWASLKTSVHISSWDTW